MKKVFKRLLMCVIMLHIITTASLTVNAATIPVLPTDVDTPADGNVFVGIEGSYPEMKTALAKMNKVRLEACKEGVPNPDNPSKKLTMDDYVPLKWSRDLEEICRIRAAEAAVAGGHTRLNGNSCYVNNNNNDIFVFAECLASYGALGYTYKEGDDGDCVNIWESEKSAWVNREKGKTTGHYTSMITPSIRYVGISAFCITKEEKITYAAQYTGEQYDDRDNIVKLDESRLRQVAQCIQTLEIKKKYISEPKIVRPYPLPGWEMEFLGYTGAKKDQKPLAVKESEQYICVYDVIEQEITDGREIDRLLVLGDIKWSSQKPSIVSIDNEGNATYKKKGKAKINAIQNGKVIASKTINVNNKAVGKASIKKLTGGKKKFTISVNLKSNATGYEIQYCKNKNFKKGVVAVTYTPRYHAKGYVVKDMPKGTFYVRVRGLKQVKIFFMTSPWSKAKKVKIR